MKISNCIIVRAYLKDEGKQDVPDTGEAEENGGRHCPRVVGNTAPDLGGMLQPRTRAR